MVSSRLLIASGGTVLTQSSAGCIDIFGVTDYNNPDSQPSHTPEAAFVVAFHEYNNLVDTHVAGDKFFA